MVDLHVIGVVVLSVKRVGMDTMSSEHPSLGEENDVYIALSSREVADLEKLLLESGFSIENAKTYTDNLSKEVSSLEYKNICDILASVNRNDSVVKSIDDIVAEAKELKKSIESSESRLGSRDIVFQVQEKETLFQIENENCRKLRDTLEALINQLQFPKDQEDYLFEGDISTEKGIRIALSAANTLADCLHSGIHPALNQLYAVQEQKSKLERIQDKFAERLLRHILRVYDYCGKQYSDNLFSNINTRDLTLPSHQVIYSILLPFSPLIKWTKNNSRSIYAKTIEGYIERVRPIYETEIHIYFEAVKDKLSGGRNTLSSNDSSDRQRRNMFSVVGMDGSKYGYASPTTADMADSISRSSELSFSEWEEFDSCVEKMLSAIEPYCLAEQQFCIDYFDIEGLSVAYSISGGGSSTGRNHHRRTSSWASQSASVSVSPSPSNPSQSSGEVSEPRRSEALRQRMAEIFSKLEQEFSTFIAYFDKLGGLYSMYLLARLTQHVLSTQDTGSFLAKAYGTILIQVKRNFDKFMLAQKMSIEESKVPKKPKCGVLPFIKGFEQFAKQAESVFKGASRRTDIDRWYTTLMLTMFETVDKLSLEHPKTPSEIIRLENYHYLQNLLWTLKIQCLENERNEAKKRYKEALRDYVAKYFGRPLEKLNTFFEGVQMKVSQGVKAEEVGYQLAYSKQELRKVIKDCNLKEVRKGLEEMYKKVEKHVSESDSTLIQVRNELLLIFTGLISYFYISGNMAIDSRGIYITIQVSSGND